MAHTYTPGMALVEGTHGGYPAGCEVFVRRGTEVELVAVQDRWAVVRFHRPCFVRVCRMYGQASCSAHSPVVCCVPMGYLAPVGRQKDAAAAAATATAATTADSSSSSSSSSNSSSNNNNGNSNSSQPGVETVDAASLRKLKALHAHFKDLTAPRLSFWNTEEGRRLRKFPLRHLRSLRLPKMKVCRMCLRGGRQTTLACCVCLAPLCENCFGPFHDVPITKDVTKIYSGGRRTYVRKAHPSSGQPPQQGGHQP